MSSEHAANDSLKSAADNPKTRATHNKVAGSPLRPTLQNRPRTVKTISGLMPRLSHRPVTYNGQATEA